MSEPSYVGVDVGGTKVAAGLLRAGELSGWTTAPTVQSDGKALLEQVATTVEGLVTADTRAVGVALPSVVELATGTVLYSVNIPLEGVAVRARLSERLGLPVAVHNDGSCAALAEAYDGARLRADPLVMITVGTGLGGGIVLAGKPYGARTSATEMGHLVIGLDVSEGVPDPGSSGFPRAGSAEALAAGTELDRLAERFGRENPESALGRKLAETGSVDGTDAVTAAQAGDPVALRAVTLLGERLGLLIAAAINMLEPELVAIGGGVSRAGELLLEPARRTAFAYTLTGVGRQTRIELARRGVEAGVVGAALLASQTC